MTLPGLDHTPTDRTDALAEAQGAAYTLRLRTPRPSIDCTVRDLLLHSPLFRESPANPQPSLFQTPAEPQPIAQLLDAAGDDGTDLWHY